METTQLFRYLTLFQLYLSHTVGVIEEGKRSKQLTCHKPWMFLVEQELITLPEQWGSWCSISRFLWSIYRSMFVWSLYCLSYFRFKASNYLFGIFNFLITYNRIEYTPQRTQIELRTFVVLGADCIDTKHILRFNCVNIYYVIIYSRAIPHS